MRVTDLLRSMDIFSALPSDKVATIAHLLHERRLAESEVLCRQGDPGDAMFIVTGGRIRLSTSDPSGNEKVLTHFSDGQFFGETAILTGAPRSATATAETESQVLVFDKIDFDALLFNHPQSMREILKVVSQRTLQTNQLLLAEDGGNAVKVGAGGVYVVFSPRGGAGKTTLAVNLAVQQALEQPDRTALIDLSLTFGHAAALLGLEPEQSLAGVPLENLADFGRLTLGRYLVEHSSGLQVLVAGTRPEEGEAVTAAHVRAALGTMKRQFTATFVDCGSSFDEPTITALELADRVIMVCTPELNTLRDVRECQRVFGEIIRLDPMRVCFVFNHNQPFTLLRREQFESTLEQVMLAEVPHAGEAAYTAASRGEPMVTANQSTTYAHAIQKLVHLLVPAEAKPTQKRGLSALGRPATAAPTSVLRARRAS